MVENQNWHLIIDIYGTTYLYNIYTLLHCGDTFLGIYLTFRYERNDLLKLES